MTNKIYAPVKITTLCRYEHFKRCIESLARCTGSDQTEIFIGLDYPKNESHVEGHKKLYQYIDTITGFKNVVVVKHKQNVGQTQNSMVLRDLIRERYPYYISTEDDNEFSKDFLLYMNQCLSRYEKDTRVYAVCGYVQPFDYFNHLYGYKANAYPIHGYFPWGTGFWFDKNTDATDFVTLENTIRILKSFTQVKKLFSGNLYMPVHRLLHRYKDSRADLIKICYCVIENKYCIFPAQSKVRNHGFDGSGLHCAAIDIYEKQKISTQSSFELDDFEICDYPEILKVQKKYYSKNWLIRRFIEFEYFVWRITGINISTFSISKKIRKKSLKYRFK